MDSRCGRKRLNTADNAQPAAVAHGAEGHAHCKNELRDYLGGQPTSVTPTAPAASHTAPRMAATRQSRPHGPAVPVHGYKAQSPGGKVLPSMRDLGLIPQSVDRAAVGAHPIRSMDPLVSDNRPVPIYDVKGMAPLGSDMQRHPPTTGQYTQPVSVSTGATRPVATFKHKHSNAVRFQPPGAHLALTSDNWRVNGNIFRQL